MNFCFHDTRTDINCINSITHMLRWPLIVQHLRISVSLWARTTKNTGPLARPFDGSLASFTRSLAPDCSLRSRTPLRSLVRSLARSLAYFAHSLARGTVIGWLFIVYFFSIPAHSTLSHIFDRIRGWRIWLGKRNDCLCKAFFHDISNFPFAKNNSSV